MSCFNSKSLLAENWGVQREVLSESGSESESFNNKLKHRPLSTILLYKT